MQNLRNILPYLESLGDYLFYWSYNRLLKHASMHLYAIKITIINLKIKMKERTVYHSPALSDIGTVSFHEC